MRPGYLEDIWEIKLFLCEIVLRRKKWINFSKKNLHLFLNFLPQRIVDSGLVDVDFPVEIFDVLLQCMTDFFQLKI